MNLKTQIKINVDGVAIDNSHHDLVALLGAPVADEEGDL